MQLKAYLLDDDRGVSPVIGVILMVAITVILAAVIATFVMNMGPETNQPANAQWKWTDDGSGTVTLEHNGGGEATASEYKIVDEDGNEEKLSTSNLFDTDAITAGNSATFSDIDGGSAFADGEELQLIWMDPESDQTQIVDTYEVSA